jgi:hypothetical protein
MVHVMDVRFYEVYCLLLVSMVSLSFGFSLYLYLSECGYSSSVAASIWGSCLSIDSFQIRLQNCSLIST